MTKIQPSEKDDFLTSNIKALLQEKFWLLESRLLKKRMASPYKTLTDAEARILSALRGEELTISEIARRLAISRQAVHKVVSKLVDEKILKLEKIERNSRDKQIVFTKAGEAMKKEASNLLQTLEQEVEAAIGSNNFRLLKSLLRKQW